MNNLTHPHHDIPPNAQLRADLTWWAEFLDVFNGKSFFVGSEPVELEEYILLFEHCANLTPTVWIPEPGTGTAL